MTGPLNLRPERAGVYRTPADAGAIRIESGAGAAVVSAVDVHAVRSKRELLEALSGALALPDSFGRNWDALADSLQDLPVPENGWLLHLEHGSALQAPLGSDWLTLLEILGEAAIYWKGRGRAFVVLIDGATELPLWR